MESYLKKLLQNQAKFKETAKDFMMCCPYHGDNTPSFGVNKENGTFNCFSCGVKGSVLDLTQKIHNITKPDAIKKLVAEGIYKEQKASSTLVSSEVVDRFCFDTNKENWLRLSIKELKTRGIIGNLEEDYEPFKWHFVDYLSKKRGFSPKTLHNHASVFVIKKDVAVKIIAEENESVVTWGAGNLLIAYRNEAGDLITLKYHDTNTEKKDGKIYLPLAKLNNSFFNSILYRDQALCFVVEGEMDALALNYCGFNAIAVGSLQRLIPTLQGFIETPQRFYIGLPDFMLGESLNNFLKQSPATNKFCYILDELRNNPQHKITAEQFGNSKDVCDLILNEGRKRLINLVAPIVAEQISKVGNYYEGKNLFGCYTLNEVTRFVCRKNRAVIVEEVQIDNKDRYKEQLGNFLFGFKAELKPLFYSVANYCNLHFTRPILRKKNRPDVLSDQLFMENDGNLYINSYIAGGYHKERNILDYNKKDFANLTADNYVKVFKESMPHLKIYLDKVLNTAVNGDDAIAFYINFIAIKWHEPSFKLPRIIIMQGDQGSGKGTFIEIIQKIFGNESVSSVRDISKKFNKLLANRLFWFIDEEEDHKKVAETYAVLKNNTGSVSLEVEGKRENSYNLDNYATPIITSNEVEPILKIQPNDRRVLYFNSNWIRKLLQEKKQKEVDALTEQYFREFRDVHVDAEIETFVKFIGNFKPLINKAFLKTYKSNETVEVSGRKDDLFVFLENLITQPEVTVSHYNTTRLANEPMHPPVINKDYGIPQKDSPYCIIKREDGCIEINNESLTLLVSKQIGRKINKQKGVRSFISKYTSIKGIDSPVRKKMHHFGHIYWYKLAVQGSYRDVDDVQEFKFEGNILEKEVVF